MVKYSIFCQVNNRHFAVMLHPSNHRTHPAPLEEGVEALNIYSRRL